VQPLHPTDSQKVKFQELAIISVIPWGEQKIEKEAEKASIV
jgi:hypothetical protein